MVYITDLSGVLTNKTKKNDEIGYYYFDGYFWQKLSANIPTEPWQVQVQGATIATAATTNDQPIYQTGSVGIGSSAIVPAAYKFQVSGASNIIGNSTIGGNETVAGTLNVTGATGLSNSLTVAGVSNLNGTTNAKATNINGQLNYKPGGTAPTANTYLRADASGNATWQALPTYPVVPTQPWFDQSTNTQATLNSQNIYQSGNVTIGTSAAPKAFQVYGTSNISGATTLGSTLTVAGVSNLNGTTNAKATNISGQLNYKPGGTAPTANTYLRTDASGNATWQALPATATTEPWQVQGGATLATTNAQAIYQQGNVAIGTASSTAASAYKLDVNGTSNVSGNSRVGSSTVVNNQTVGGVLTVGSGTLPSAAALGVQTTGVSAGTSTSTKGFIYPRVNLTNLLSLAPLIASGGTAAEKLQNKGVTVYNTTNTSAIPEGVYFWNGVQWLKLVTQIPVVTSVIADLKQATDIPLGVWNSPVDAIALNFGSLAVNESGSYALLIRFYGQAFGKDFVGNLTYPSGTSMYVWVYRKSAAGVETIADAAELSFTLPAASQGTYIAAFTAALTVPNALAGETLIVKMSTNPAIPQFRYRLKNGTAPAAARTSLFYWKL